MELLFNIFMIGNILYVLFFFYLLTTGLASETKSLKDFNIDSLYY